jgi:hypothetical protein
MIENIYSADPNEALNHDARMNIVKAAVGLVLAGDDLGISRLRSKFSDRLAQTPEWGMFDYITSPDVDVTGKEFKAAARAVADVDSIDAFLKAYRQMYPVDQQLAPSTATQKAAV